MTLLERMRELAAKACPDYRFEFETARMMNVDADDKAFPCVFFEEYTEAQYVNSYGWRKRALVELSFMRLAPFQCGAELREELRDKIEQEAVLPFISALNTEGTLGTVTEFTCLPEPPRFDANAVSLLLRFWVTMPTCSL